MERLRAWRLPKGTISYSYDPVTGQLIETSTAFTDVKYTYDAFGQATTVATDMTNGVKLATPLVATYAYDNAGNLISVTEPNGVKTTYTYDELDRLTSVKVTSAGGQLISSDTYTLDDLGRRVADDGFQLQTDGTLDEVRVSWAYNALGRLVEEASTDITGERPELSYTTTYSYDLVGNILTRQLRPPLVPSRRLSRTTATTSSWRRSHRRDQPRTTPTTPMAH